MPTGITTLDSFNAGEWSPRLRGRVDLAKYFNALELCRNYLIQPHGGLERRPGTVYVAGAKYNDRKVRLIPFEFSADQTYMLEFGDMYIRFYANGGQIKSGGVPVEVATPYAHSDLQELRFAQSADFLYIVHPEYQPRTLARLDDITWQLDEFLTEDGPWLEKNFTKKHKVKITSTTGPQYNITAIDAVNNIIQISGDRTTEVLEGELVEVRSSTANDGVYEVVGTSLSGGGDTDVEIVPGLDDLDTTVDGQMRLPMVVTATRDTWSQADADSNRQMRIRGQTGPINWGWGYIVGFTNAKSIRLLTIDGFGATGGKHRWQLGAFGEPDDAHPVETAGWPAAVTFHQQRLWFANTQGAPQTLWGSRSGDFPDFAISEQDNTVEDDHGIDATLDSDEVQSIHWMKATSKGLAVGTASAEWLVNSGSDGGAITPSNIFASEQTFWGSRRNPDSFQIENGICYPSRTGHILRLFGFEFATDQYSSSDLNMFAEHILKNSASPQSGISQMVYVDEPESMIWALTDNNELFSLTIDSKQDVMAWQRHTIGGTDVRVISIGTINESPNPQLWLAIERTIDGSTVQYIERLNERFDFVQNQEDAFFVDSGLTYNGVSATVISGLDHLEGETLKVLGDGAVLPDVTVSGGSVTVSKAITTGIFGLAYESKLITMPVEPRGSRAGDPRGMYKRPVWALIQFYRSLGGEAGWWTETDSGTDVVIARTFVDLLGDPPALFTGMKKVTMGAPSSRLINFQYVIDDPLPCNILAVHIQMDVGGA